MASEKKAGTRAADALQKYLEEQILSGALPEGSVLPPERELMTQFETSRTVVREAITSLTNRGLLENRPRFRPVVRKPGYDAAMDALGGIARHLLGTKQGVSNLYELRIFIESSLVRQAATHATREHISKLKEALEVNLAAIDDPVAFDQSDIAFHSIFYEIPENPVFPALHRTFTAWLSQHWLEMERTPELNRSNYEKHCAIYEAILERDPDRAEKLLKAHLNSSWEDVEGTFVF
ncbi:FCD domain-containing protein [Rhodobacteraceae bacterium RKSG542]|uniref:FCD domain-containing protein n=1 Tax=Pseudovibrio flavus TaxID=2529854 RepID=UPI0012BC0FE0|nr:FCD domain-containing protein [Pseudovibrio flavus]MTI16024.1 FCD domain-containing protein [Pseudovibrio flavus]